METRRLYYEDSHLKEFDAAVLSCQEGRDGWHIYLDATAFFPEGGGQAGDRGTLDGVQVLDTREMGGAVCHVTDSPLPVGKTVHGVLDWAFRFENMQGHSGEHIVSGLVFRRFGYANVGFHMGAEGIIVDFDGFISPEELREIELAANAVIWENHPVRTLFPEPRELGNYSYRSKLDLTENVRLVEIEGVDLCACCAPHVKETGQVGLIRILDSIRRKDGVRIRMLAGSRALAHCLTESSQNSRISSLLSAKPGETADAVKRLMEDRDAISYRLGGFMRREAKRMGEDFSPAPFGLFFSEDFSDAEARILANTAGPKCEALCAVFFGGGDGRRYIIAAGPGGDVRGFTKDMNAALSGRGGGSAAMSNGSVKASEQEIRDYFGRYFHEN